MVTLEEQHEQWIEQLAARLRARLSPEDYHLVGMLRQAEELAAVAACTAWEQRMLEALVQHIPDQELAIRRVITHVYETNADCDTLRGLRARRPRG
jgi:hypothetical protein